MDRIELNNGMTIKCQMLNKIEFYQILKENNGILLEKYSISFEQLEVYELSNKNVLVKEDDYYTLYYSLSDLDSVLANASDFASGQVILLNKNPYGKDFPNHTSKLIQELLQNLNIPTNLPINKDILKLVDTEIFKINGYQNFERDHFIHLIAIVGEVLKNDFNANWEMNLSSDGKTWNPYLKIKGNDFEFFTYLYEDIFLTEKRKEPVLLETYLTVNAIVNFN